MNQLVNPVKALRTLRKNATILDAVLAGVSQGQAVELRDGPDGWSVLFIVCHLRDIEAAFSQRVRDVVAEPGFSFRPIDVEGLVTANNYAAQDLRSTLAELAGLRRDFVAFLEGLSDEQWLLAGVHPVQGPGTVLDIAINTGLHDIDHIEQIVRCLEPIR